MLIEKLKQARIRNKMATIEKITFMRTISGGFAVLVEYTSDKGYAGIVNLLDNNSSNFSTKEKFNELCKDFRNLAEFLSSDIVYSPAPNEAIQAMFGGIYYLNRRSA